MIRSWVSFMCSFSVMFHRIEPPYFNLELQQENLVIWKEFRCVAEVILEVEGRYKEEQKF